MGVAAAFTAASAVAASYAQRQAGKIASEQAAYNQRVSEIAAADARRRGDVDEQRQRRRTSQLIGAQRAAIGQSGFVVDVGTAQGLVSDAELFGELDALTVRNNAAREVWGLKEQAMGYAFEGQLGRLQSSVGALSSLASGAAQTYGVYRSTRNP